MPHNQQHRSDSIFTVPNVLSAIRLSGSFLLAYLAWRGNGSAFLGVFIVLIATDWIDGKLAILLHQRTETGARLDSAADATLYAALLFGILWLKWDFVLQSWPWFAVGLASYAMTSLAGLLKFGSIPSYHTYTAKGSAHIVVIAVVCLFADWATWPIYVAIVAVTVANLEAILITLLLRQRRVDVLSVLHVRRHNQLESDD
jgi:CDP-diacylglycerol--glycerol-3-phosphate 3-phosphatidyltransferase